MPNTGIIVATVIPVVLVLAVKDVAGLADLYAVGVVGAIATNLGASSTDSKLGLARWERVLMFCTFLIMLAIEISLFVDKPNARRLCRHRAGHRFGLARPGQRIRAKKDALPQRQRRLWRRRQRWRRCLLFPGLESVSGAPMMCAVRGTGKTLDFAIDEAKETNRPLYLLFVRALPVLSEEDRKRKWQDDDEAREIFSQARAKAEGHPVFPCYAVSDSVADTIVDITATMGASFLILGAPERRGLVSLLRGNVVREISEILPEDIHLLVYA